MEKKEVKITIDKEGNVSFDVSGVKGSSCTALTQNLEQAISGEMVEPERELKESYYEEAENIYDNEG